MARPSRRIFMFLAPLALAMAPALAEAALTEAKDATVKFHASGPAGLKIEGVTHDFAVREAGGEVRFVVPLANLDTGISLRNKHMREKYLEVSKFPNAELAVKRSALPAVGDGATAAAQVDGAMTIHGVTKPVKVSVKATRSGSRFVVHGQAPLDIRDYNIHVPSYLGVTVRPDITVEVDVTLVDH